MIITSLFRKRSLRCRKVKAYRTINVRIPECAARNSEMHALKVRLFDRSQFSLCVCNLPGSALKRIWPNRNATSQIETIRTFGNLTAPVRHGWARSSLTTPKKHIGNCLSKLSEVLD